MTAVARRNPAVLRDRYDLFTRTLHWIFAAIILYAMVAGFSLHIITNQALWHFMSMLNMSLTTCLIPLFPVRFVWSFFRPEVAPIESIPRWQRGVAHLVHSLIYALAAFVLVSGVIMTPDGFRFFGLFFLPTPFSQGQVTDHWFVLHKAGCYALMLLVAAHIGAALKHHFVERNGLLRTML